MGNLMQDLDKFSLKLELEKQLGPINMDTLINAVKLMVVENPAIQLSNFNDLFNLISTYIYKIEEAN